MVHHPTKTVALATLPKEILLPRCGAAGGEDCGEVRQTSELVAQRQLNLANRAYNVKATTPGNAKGTVCKGAVTRAKNMAVKSVWNINLKYNGLPFVYGGAF
jgi:hypothetical protein